MKASSFFIKLFITAFFAALILWAVDVEDLWSHILAIPAWAIAAAALAWGGATVLNTLRWMALLRIQGITIYFFQLLQYGVAFMFYVVVLPGGKVSAEAVRVYQIAKDTEDGKREAAALSALADRTIGVLMFVFLAATTAPLVAAKLPSFPMWLLVVLVISALAAFIGVCMPVELVFFKGASFAPPMLRDTMERLGNAWKIYRSQPKSLIAPLGLSLVSALLMALGVHAVVLSLGVYAPFTSTIAAFSLGSLAAMIPLTIAGIGVREGAFTFLFAAFTEASLEVGLSVSLVILVASLALAAIGGLVEFRRLFFLKAQSTPLEQEGSMRQEDSTEHK